MAIIEERAIYNVDRQEAARFLDVSTRTIDRYIRSNKLSHKKVGYHVYLSMRELEEMKAKNNVLANEGEVVKKDNKTKAQHEVEIIEEVENVIYKKLFEETKEELVEKTKEVAFLNYRIGKMEHELKETVPALEYSNSVAELEKENQNVKQELTKTQEELISSITTQRHLKKTRSIYLFALFLVLAGTTLYILAQFAGATA